MIIATTVQEVVDHLDNIIDWSIRKNNRIGYFACLYRKMTIAVQQGIANNAFVDGSRMELLDVIFANRYLQALEAFINKKKCTNAWCAAFEAANTNDLVVLQHLFLGINTHINLDLGIAAAEACPGNAIYDLESDFQKINTVIANITAGVQHDLNEVWPPLGFLASLTNNRQEAVLNFSIKAAREASWANALALSVAKGSQKENHITLMDNTVTKLAGRITNPGILVRLLLRPALKMESKKIGDIIAMLCN
jgi:hypothetical protein